GKTVFNSSVPAPLLSQISQANIPFEIREKETTHQDQTVSPGTLVLLSGGYNNSGILSACQIYDSSTGKWTLTGSLANARYAFTTTLLNSGKVLAAGGGTATGTVLSSAELFTLSS